MHVPNFVWNDDLEGLPPDGEPIMLEKTSNDTIYLGTLPSTDDYHIKCIGNNKVMLMDDHHTSIKITSIDSIGYYITDDNI